MQPQQPQQPYWCGCPGKRGLPIRGLDGSRLASAFHFTSPCWLNRDEISAAMWSPHEIVRGLCARLSGAQQAVEAMSHADGSGYPKNGNITSALNLCSSVVFLFLISDIHESVFAVSSK